MDGATQERWARLSDFPLYELSDQGRVWSRITERVLSGTPTGGYLCVRLKCGAKSKSVPIHRLVCRAFHGECPPDKEMVGHLNGNALDNRAANLAWITRSENTIHSIQHGTFNSRVTPVRGASHHSAKLDPERVKAIRARLNSGDSKAALCLDFGVSERTIRRVASGENWSHV